MQSIKIFEISRSIIRGKFGSIFKIFRHSIFKMIQRNIIRDINAIRETRSIIVVDA